MSNDDKIVKDLLCRLAGPLFLLVYALVLFWPIPFADVTIAGGDILQQFYPWTEFWVSELQDGGFPLWNPYTYGGSPFLGNLQIAPFYPPQFLLPLLSPLEFFGWTLLLHAILAGWAMYLLIHWLTNDRYCATAMGLVYLSSGFLITRIHDGHVTIMNGLPWVPLAVLLYLRWAQRPSWGRWTLTALVLGVQCLGGQPQIAYLTIFLLGLIALRQSWVVYRGGERAMDRVLQPVGALLLAVLAGTLLSAAAWLPFYEFNKLSAIRSAGASYEYASKDSLPFRHLFTFLMPFLYGDPTTPQGFWGSRTGYHEICGFLGIGTLLLAMIGLLAPRFERKWFWAGVALLCLLLALGANTPLYKLLYWFLPGVRYFRVPARFLLLYSVCMCVLGGYGLKSWLWDAEKNLALHRKVYLSVAVLVIVIFYAYALANLSWVSDYSLMINDASYETLGKILPMQAQAWDVKRAFWIGILFSCAWIAVLIARRTVSGKRTLYGVVLIILIAAELGWFAHRFVEPRRTKEIIAKEYPETSAIQFLRRHAGLSRVMLPDMTIGWQYRKRYPELFPNRLMVPGLSTVRGYDQTFLRDYAAYIYRMQGISDDRFLNVFLNVFDPVRVDPKMLSALSVKYLVVPEPVQSPHYRLVAEGPPLVYEYTRAFPRAYVLPLDRSIPDEPPRDAPVEIVLDTPNEIRIEGETQRPGWLVVADNAYPEWRAELNGRPVEIQPILGAFRSVRVEPGAFQVRMFYEATSLRRGVLASLLSALVLLMVNLPALFRKRRKSVGDSVS